MRPNLKFVIKTLEEENPKIILMEKSADFGQAADASHKVKVTKESDDF